MKILKFESEEIRKQDKFNFAQTSPMEEWPNNKVTYKEEREFSLEEGQIDDE